MMGTLEQRIAQLEADLQAEKTSNEELACELARQESEQIEECKARQRSIAHFQGLLAEQDAERRAGAELLSTLQELGEWRADVSILRRATEVLRANAISLRALRDGSIQTNRFIKKLLAERHQLREQLLEADGTIAHLQILVSTPMSIEQRSAEGFVPEALTPAGL